jgi:hypothetical protein
MYKPDMLTDGTRNSFPLAVPYTEHIENRRNHFQEMRHVCSKEKITLGPKNAKMQVEKKKILERTPGGTFSLNEFT